MPPSSGHLLLPKFWRAARYAYEKAYKALKEKLPDPTQQVALRLQPSYAWINTRRPINRAAAIRQSRGRYFSTRAAGGFVSALRSGVRGDQAAYQKSRIASNIGRLTSRAPFASSLRPNLTGGTLGRTAGGYAVGAGRFGGARYFSHGPAAPAQVISQVSAGVRAFFVSGKKARFDGIDPYTGEKRYKIVGALQDQAERKMAAIPRTAPGSSIDFQISPTITAFGMMGGLQKKSTAVDMETLNSEGLMDLLSVDFARALKDLAAVLNDLKRLSTLGDLPILLQDRSTIRVRFPGCDAETVERLCDEVGVQRGLILQDEDFDVHNRTDLALLYPFAPSVPTSPVSDYFALEESKLRCSPDQLDWKAMISSEDETPLSPYYMRSPSNRPSFEDKELFGSNPWNSSPSGYSSINISELGDQAFFPEFSSGGMPETASEYEGAEGIYKFLAECDQAAQRR